MPYRFLRTLLIFAAILLIFCSVAAAQPQDKPKPKAAPVTAGEAVRGAVPILLTAIGTVEASEVVEVKARINGLLREVHFEEGQDVHRGDPLFSLDSRDLEAELRSARAGLDRVRAQLRKAVEDKRRNDDLLRQGLISRDRQETTATAQESLQAEVQEAEAAVEEAKVALSHAEIRSPIDGRTGTIQLHAGNMVKANADSPMVVISRVEPVNVRFAVPESHLAAIMAAQATAPLRVLAKPAGLPEPVAGSLSFIDSGVDARTGTIALKARFANTNRQLWPGQFADVTLEVGVLKDVVLVPERAGRPERPVFHERVLQRLHLRLEQLFGTHVLGPHSVVLPLAPRRKSREVENHVLHQLVAQVLHAPGCAGEIVVPELDGLLQHVALDHVPDDLAAENMVLAAVHGQDEEAFIGIRRSEHLLDPGGLAHGFQRVQAGVEQDRPEGSLLARVAFQDEGGVQFVDHGPDIGAGDGDGQGQLVGTGRVGPRVEGVLRRDALR